MVQPEQRAVTADQGLHQPQQGAHRPDAEVHAGQLQHRLERIDHDQGVGTTGELLAQFLQPRRRAAPRGQGLSGFRAPNGQPLDHSRIIGMAQVLEVLAHHGPGPLAAIGADPQHPAGAGRGDLLIEERQALDAAHRHGGRGHGLAGATGAKEQMVPPPEQKAGQQVFCRRSDRIGEAAVAVAAAMGVLQRQLPAAGQGVVEALIHRLAIHPQAPEGGAHRLLLGPGVLGVEQ